MEREADYEIVDETTPTTRTTEDGSESLGDEDAKPSTALAKPATLRDVNALAADLLALADRIDAFSAEHFPDYSNSQYAMKNAAECVRAQVGPALAGKIPPRVK